MIISTSRDDKQIFLWDERTGGIVFSYEDESVKTYIPRTKINVLGIYSDYIIATQENKSMFLVLSFIKNKINLHNFKLVS